MNTPSNVVPGALNSQAIAPRAVSVTRPMYWSVQRELWENRSLYVAPLIAAGVVLFGFFISMLHIHHQIRAGLVLDPMKPYEVIAQAFIFASLLIMATTFIVAVFYCLDALHSERRDRSILFWKSLPVSDFTTVLSKASIPLVLLPLLTFAITAVTQAIMLLFGSLVLMGSGLSMTTLLAHMSLWQMLLMLLYHLLAIHALWYAPIYGWLMLVSGWARRAVFLWAVLPPLALCAVEKIAFNTSYFINILKYRLGGGTEGGAFSAAGASMDPMAHIHPGGFLISPGLWIGLAVAAMFLTAAIRLRRYQGPI